MEKGGLDIQGNPQLYGDSEDRLGYPKPCFNKEVNRARRWLSGKGARSAGEDNHTPRTDAKVETRVVMAACNPMSQEVET